MVETLNAVHFDHNYEEEENGKLVRKKQQSERFTPDYSSQRIYGYGGMMPRFASKEKRGSGLSSPMLSIAGTCSRELLDRHKDWTATLMKR